MPTVAFLTIVFMGQSRFIRCIWSPSEDSGEYSDEVD